VEETERERLDRELAARTAASAAQLAQIEEQQKKIEAQVRMHSLDNLRAVPCSLMLQICSAACWGCHMSAFAIESWLIVTIDVSYHGDVASICCASAHSLLS